MHLWPRLTARTKTEIGQFLGFFLGLCLIRLWPIFAQGRALYFGDNYSLLVPAKIFTVNWLRQGVLPLWNPYEMSGLSWIGDITQSIFYPSTLFFLWLPVAAALHLDLLTHLLWGMMGMYLTARWFSKNHWSALLAAGLWMLSSQVSGGSNNLATLHSIAWLPWLLWGSLQLTQSRWGILRMAVLLAGAVYAGYPQHLLLFAPAMVVFSVLGLPEVAGRRWRKWWLWLRSWVITGVLSLGLSAMVAWPFVEALRGSTRLQQTALQATTGSLHPAELIKIFIPYFFDAPVLGVRWGPSWNVFPTALPYLTLFGLVVIVLSLWRRPWARYQKTLLVLAGFTLVMALGKYVPGVIWLMSTVPGLSSVRYPSAWLLVTNAVILCVLASSWAHFKLKPLIARWLTIVPLVGALMAAIGFGLVRWQFPWVWQLLNTVTGQALAQSAFHTPERDQLILSIIAANVAINLLFLSLAVWLHRRGRQVLLVAVLLLDALFNSQGIWLFAPKQIYDPPQNQALIDQLKTPDGRVLTRNFNQPYTDFGSYWEALAVRWPFSDSFIDHQELTSATHLQRLRDGLTPDWNMTVDVPTVHGYVTLTPTEYQTRWESGEVARINALSTIPLNHPQLSNWAVKYYVVDEWFKINEDVSALKPVYRSYPWTVYELPSLSRFRYENDEAISYQEFRETPNSLSFKLTNETSHGYLKIADRYEEGWQAMVNQQPVRVENWDGLRAIPIAPGENVIEMQYRPMSFIWGRALTLVSAMFLAAGVVYVGWQARKKKHKK